ncbi:elongator complex protein 6 [Neosynchiropus ocellatus]
MFPELNAVLNWSPDDVTQGQFILLSDRRSDASFLVHHFLSFYIRGRCRVCFLGLVQSFSHYSAVCQRLGVNLSQAREKGQLTFLEGLNEALTVLSPSEGQTGSGSLDFLQSPSLGLRGLFRFIRSSLSGPGASDGEWGPPVLLVDDLSVLLGLGVDVAALLDFSHYCKASICSQLQGNVVMLARCDGQEEDYGDDEDSERLLRGLTHQCGLSIKVQGLPTGYCRDIHGQMQVSWKNLATGQHTHERLLQYKVHDKGASFFARGTSAAVL